MNGKRFEFEDGLKFEDNFFNYDRTIDSDNELSIYRVVNAETVELLRTANELPMYSYDNGGDFVETCENAEANAGIFLVMPENGVLSEDVVLLVFANQSGPIVEYSDESGEVIVKIASGYSIERGIKTYCAALFAHHSG